MRRFLFPYCIRLLASLLLLLPISSHAGPVLTPLENGQEFTVKPRQLITVKLPAMPSTGYTWFFTLSDKGTIELKQDQQFRPWHKDDPRSPGDTTWQFIGKNSGAVTLRFSYRKNGSDEALDVREYRIVVQANNSRLHQPKTGETDPERTLEV